jgi:hypothetical protein
MKCVTAEALLSLAAMLACLALPAEVHAASSLAISPTTATVAPRATQQFTASGGSGSGYTWSLTSAPSGGTISGSGLYKAGPTPNVVDDVQVIDSAFDVATATVTVGGGLAIAPPGITLAPGNTQQFTASGGMPPYTWQLVTSASGGSVSAAGLYTAGPAVGKDTLRLGDSVGGSTSVPIDVVAVVPQGTACTTSGTCPATSDGNAYCVDGVCCNSACAGQCQACNTASSLGSCVTIAGTPVGTRPRCPVDDSSNVCTTKRCDGNSPTSCNAYVGGDVTCHVATCVDLVGTPSSVCQGDGGCPDVDASSCFPFACVSSACATVCTNTSECSPGNYCDVTTGQCLVPDASATAVAVGPSSPSPPPPSSGCSVGSVGAEETSPLFVVAALAGFSSRRRRATRRARRDSTAAG